MIASMFYPGLPSHPDHELAKTVFSSGGDVNRARRGQTFGGMLAFIVAGDNETALRRGRRMCERLKVIDHTRRHSRARARSRARAQTHSAAR